jgi:flagellar assembly protein FliH
MRAAPAKYMFENDFASAAAGKPSIPLDEHTAKLREAEAAAYARGVEQAKVAAANEGAQRSATALESIAAALGDLDKRLGAVEARIESEAVEVAVAVARKLAPELVAREPLAEMSALAAGCFRNLVKTPHVAVRVNDALHGAARQQLEDIVHRCGLDSRLVVLAEPDIAPGDCLIEWADGGIHRDSAAIAAAIKDAVKRYITARLASAEPPAVASPDIQRRDQQ